MLSSRTERNLFSLFTTAFVLAVGGVGLMYASRRQDVPDAFLYMAYGMMAIGAVILAYALLLLFTLCFTPNKAHAKTTRRCKVMARYLLGENGVVLVNEMPDPELKQRLMVKLEFLPDDIGDYECSPEIYRVAEIHKTGTATVQGTLVHTFELDPETA